MLGNLINKLTAKSRAKKEEYKKQQERIAKEIKEELSNPDYTVIEKIFRKPASSSLKKLYQNQSIVQSEYLNKVNPYHKGEEISITIFNPLNEKVIKGQWCQTGKHFAFGNDGSGSEWVIDPTEEDPVIFYFEHESNELISTNLTLNEFIELPNE